MTRERPLWPHKQPPANTPYRASIGLKELHRFKSRWPCHGFPDNLARVVFSFEADGDLCDVEAFSRRHPLDIAAFDGPALVALALHAQRKVHPRHAAERETK
jgi:hypothetical protein